MGWRGALRSMEAAARRAEREARRHHNELLRQQKQYQKMLERERAALEVQLYENRIELLRSIQKDCGPEFDWQAIHSAPAPIPPIRSNTREQQAKRALDGFEPNFWDRLFKRVESKRNVLTAAINQAQDSDANEYAKALDEHQTETANWQMRKEIAGKVLAGDAQAFKKVIEELSPFSEINDLGSTVNIRFNNLSAIEVILNVNDQDVIPREVKSLLQSGKLSSKKMPQVQFYELYQDYICGCVLRVSRVVP